MSIRAVERLTGVHRNTIMRLDARVGRGCAELHDRMMVGLRVPRIECDELWAYVGCKQKNVTRKNVAVKGDQYTYVALAASTKAILAYRTGKRDSYQGRISGPLLDRIDLHIEVPAVTAADLILPPPTDGSREVAERVALARERQAARFAAIGLPHLRSNAAVSGAVLEDVARPDARGLSLLREAADAMRLSARGYHRVLRVARTLADLDGAEKVGRVHLAEALSYRALADEIRRAA
jgi:hypothetical protein